MRSVVRQTLATIVAAFAFVAGATLVGTEASANDRPFWEKSDAPKAKSSYSKNAYYKKSSRKYAKSSGKKSYAGRKKLGGYAAATEPKRYKGKGYRVAALGGGNYGNYQPKKSLSGGGVRWVASSGCLDGALKSVVYQVASNFGPVTVNSTCRSKGRNRAVGGAGKSHHLSGNAVDFRVHGNVRGVYAFLKSSGSVGGLKHYGGGLFHIDTGARRSW